ncbi:DKNYY domain-containing protein [Variovorax sp. J22G73]|uniref:DKNYY domain-containing protein n=1 Tax=unclassified Variovorax TaxID=663243 RepID=UPI002578D5AD|nr:MULTISPECIES: DKNYY domain-containing protein [unclassified Variovorax]MDM0008408.1 DKNYY domain-containing protein [Variovorax sp. J22R203]MDM0100916.1 DKNYY domain-containing protein [Variovorax sp. J22G73]
MPAILDNRIVEIIARSIPAAPTMDGLRVQTGGRIVFLGFRRWHALVLSIALTPTYALALSCPEYISDYLIKDGVVSFWANPPLIERRVRELDVRSFQPIHPPDYGMAPCSTLVNDYASDGTRIFYRGELIKGAKLAGFRLLGDGYSADENSVFGKTARITGRVSDFKKVGPFGTDGVRVFYQNRKLKGTNLESLPSLYGIYRTSTAVYNNRGEIVKADPASMRVLIPSNNLWRDRSKVFLGSKSILGADPDTFESIGNYFYRDKRAVYLDGREIHGMDPRTARQFRFQGLYSTDGKAVFKRHVPIDRDPATFTAEMQSWYTKDKNGVYYDDVLIKDADTDTFETTALNYARDKNYSYEGKNPYCAWREGLRPEIKLCNP